MTKDRFIVEALGGEVYNPFYSRKLDTHEGFFWLWERFQKHEKWSKFLNKYGIKSVSWDFPGSVSNTFIKIDLIHLTRFRDAVAEFFGWEEEG